MFSKFSQLARFSLERLTLKKIITETLQSRIQNQSQSAWGITMIVEDPNPKPKKKSPKKTQKNPRKNPKIRVRVRVRTYKDNTSGFPPSFLLVFN